MTDCKYHTECGRQSVAKGLCHLHYKRNKRTSFPEKRMRAIPGTGRSRNAKGYIIIWRDGKAYQEHVWLAEQALGKTLPKGAVVHHMNKKKDDNFTPLNLVICPDQDYHLLLHRRMRGLII